MMKKFLFVAAAVVASMVFTGCINEDDTYKKLQPVEKGINIYNWTSSQYFMATEQANIGLRMAMLVAEAHKQGVDNFEDVKIEGISIKGKLLGTSSKIEKTTTGYKITFNPAYMDMDGYSREGAVLIDTGGAPLLEDAVAGKVWSVTFDERLRWWAVPRSSTTMKTEPMRSALRIRPATSIRAAILPRIGAAV